MTSKPVLCKYSEHITVNLAGGSEETLLRIKCIEVGAPLFFYLTCDQSSLEFELVLDALPFLVTHEYMKGDYHKEE